MKNFLKKLSYFLLIFLLSYSNLYALSDNYIDKISDVVNANVDEDKINIYLFYIY